jgi:hypothetical protein
MWSRTTYSARDETRTVTVKTPPQPTLITPLMGAHDGFAKAALSSALSNDPYGEKMPLGAVCKSVTRIVVPWIGTLMIHTQNDLVSKSGRMQSHAIVSVVILSSALY